MRAVFYSGGQTSKNQLIHEALVSLFPRKSKLSMTYVPVWEEGSKVFFSRARRRYERFGVGTFRCLTVDRPVSRKELDQALRSDIVYLAGGNTYHYLYHLKKSGLFSRLRAFSKRGGVLVGLSAGGILLTPHLGLAAYPDFEADDNDTPLKDREKALGLVDFEYFPHYRRNKRLINALRRYSKTGKHPIMAVRDGSGLVIDEGRTTCIGSVSMIHRGQELILSK